MSARVSGPSLADFGDFSAPALTSVPGPSLDDFTNAPTDPAPSTLPAPAPLTVVPTPPPSAPAETPATPEPAVPAAPSSALALIVPSPAGLVPSSPSIPVEIAAPLEGIRADFTFSKGPLARSGCTAWLAKDVPWYSGPDTTYQTGGRANHETMRDITRAAVLRAPMPKLPEDAKAQAMILRATHFLLEKGILRHKTNNVADSIVGGGPLEAILGVRAEVALAYDTATRKGRVLEDPQGWDVRWYADPEKRAAYPGEGGPIRDTEICGRVDLMCVGFDESGSFGWVKDWKFHYGPSAKDAQGQLELCALALQTAYDLDRVEASALHVWEDRDVAEEHLADEHGVTVLGPAAIARIAGWVDGLARPAANDPIPHEGPHCADRDCPAVAACPVTGAIVEQVLPAETLVRRRIAEPLETNEDAAWALIAADILMEVGEQLKARAKMFADENEGIVQSDGRVYAGKPIMVEKPDLAVAGAVDALRELGLEAAIKPTATWTEIQKAGAAKYGPTKAEKIAKEVLRAISAIKPSVQVRYEARTPKAGAS